MDLSLESALGNAMESALGNAMDLSLESALGNAIFLTWTFPWRVP